MWKRAAIAVSVLATIASAAGYLAYTLDPTESQHQPSPQVVLASVPIDAAEDEAVIAEEEAIAVEEIEPTGNPTRIPMGSFEEVYVGTIPKQNSFTIVGEALDASSGEPIAGIEVHAIVWDDTLFRAQSKFDFGQAPSATTDEAGRFELTELRHLTYALMTEHPTYVMTQPARKYKIYRRFKEHLVTLSMEEGGNVAGVASFMEFPLPDQEIVLKYKEDSSAELRTTTDANGAYMFEGLRSGSAVVSTNLASLGSDESLALRARIETGQITVVDLPFGGLDAAIFGRVYPYEPDLQYIVTAQNTVAGQDKAVHTIDIDEDGSFFFSSLPSGNFRVGVEAVKSRQPNRKLEALVRTDQGNVATHDFYFYNGYGADGYISNLLPGEVLSVIATKTVRAPEIDQRILKLIRNASTTYHAQVDESGMFWFENLEPGTYMIVAEGAKNRIGVATINVQPDRYSQSRRLEPGEEMDLTLLDLRAAPEF